MIGLSRGTRDPLDWIGLGAGLTREPILATIFSRDNYRQEVITIPPRTLRWNILFNFLCDWAMIRTHQEDQKIEDVISLIEYMSDFIRPPPPLCVNDSEEFYRMSRVIF